MLPDRKESHGIGSIVKHASFATLYLSYALLDMINLLFVLPFEIQLHVTTIHQPLICPEQLTELHICSISLFPPNESVSSEPAASD